MADDPAEDATLEASDAADDMRLERSSVLVVAGCEYAKVVVGAVPDAVDERRS